MAGFVCVRNGKKFIFLPEHHGSSVNRFVSVCYRCGDVGSFSFGYEEEPGRNLKLFRLTPPYVQHWRTKKIQKHVGETGEIFRSSETFTQEAERPVQGLSLKQLCSIAGIEKRVAEKIGSCLLTVHASTGV